MYAVIKTGGKQYRVSAGQKLKIEQIPADLGATVTFNEVLAVGSGADVVFGAPLVSGAKVDATVVSHGRGDKVTIFKMRRRKHYQRHGGHRQNYTEVFFSAIFGADGTELAKADVPAMSAPVALAASVSPVAAAKPAAAKPAAAKKSAKVRGKARDGSDDLELIEGVGPKIAELLKAAGIDTFDALAKAPVEKVQEVLEAGGSKFNLAKPETWAEQAALAASGDWAAFDKLTEALVGGVRK